MQNKQPIPVPSMFGPRLKVLRKYHKMTQQAVADRLRIHRTTYTKYETGVVTPDQQGLVCLAELFGVTVDYLLGREVDCPTELPLESDEDTPVRLTLQEKMLIQTFRQLKAEKQADLVKQAREILVEQRFGKR